MPLKRRALILVNLGTPTSPTPRAVRQFLRQFLSDRRVVDLPPLLWWPILYGIILPLRAPRVARLYQKIWWRDGSPLEVITRRQVDALQRYCDQQQEPVIVRHAMVYGEPSLNSVCEVLRGMSILECIILPLYPQFCSATTGSVTDQVMRIRTALDREITVTSIPDYHQHPAYLAALANSVQWHWKTHGRGEKLLFSFHGIPQALVDRGDPYFQQCHETAKQVAGLLELLPEQWSVCFQSRFGKAQWVQPYTDQVVMQCAQQGIRNLDVITPAFASDCLETLEEIAVQLAESFEAAGGNALRLIPCLNDNNDHIEMMYALFKQHVPLHNRS